MVEFINNHFGTKMWVAEDRVDEYKAAGHRLAASPVPTKTEPEEDKEDKEVKEVKKTSKKK